MRARLLLLAGALLAAGTAASAQTAEPFYHGKTIRFISSAGVAGGFEGYARSFAAHFPDHLAGRPSIIVESMPGAGGLRAANHLFNQAARDGTVIGIIHSPLPFQPIYGNKAARYDAREFNWLGSIDTSTSMCISWQDSPVKSWDDLQNREFIVGSVGSGSGMDVLPTMLNRLFHTHMRIVSGYGDGVAILMAMERGEVEGRCGGMLTVLKATRPDWIAERKFTIPIVLSDHRLKDYPDSPSLLEMVSDSRLRLMLQLIFAQQKIDRPLLAPPALPPERVAELRAAFDATMADPEFVRDAKGRNLTLDPITGAEVAEIIRQAYDTPPEIVAMAREALGNQPAE
jgi:tripartite-type tricarboxylate transporter receptor subunit TctC